MSDGPVPTWVHKLIDGLMAYDAEHPKLYYETGAAPGERIPAECPCHLLALVPDEAKRDARMFMDGVRAAVAEHETLEAIRARMGVPVAQPYVPEGETGQFIERGERG